jgi:hypothetical protein
MSFTMASRCVRDSARVFNPNPPHAPQQASDLITSVVIALVLASLIVIVAVL